MSKQNNVNPDYYKVAGRERPGKANPVKAKARYDRGRHERARWSERKKDRGAELYRAKIERPVTIETMTESALATRQAIAMIA